MYNEMLLVHFVIDAQYFCLQDFRVVYEPSFLLEV